MNCSQLGEFELIARLARKLPRDPSVVVGVGDDCAVLRSADPKKYLLFKTDPVIEGTHFVFRSQREKTIPRATPFQVGWKAIARNLSDIAAMGGLPRWALVSLGLPAKTDVRVVDDIYRGLHACASRFGATIVGGDTSQTSDNLFVVVSLIGEVEKKFLKLRSTARSGQMVFVTGTLGGSLLGKHLKFTPRIAEARWLVQNFPIGAMIDVSDGLAGDLKRLSEKSGVGFDILVDAIPMSSAAHRSRDPLRRALRDGEDFELLFTLPANKSDALLKAWYSKFKLPLTPLGIVTSASGRIRLISPNSSPKNLTRSGYEHFR
jgi:thiamine-monophosphate kinase